MSSAGEDLQHVDPGKALARLPEGGGSDAWADLRPAYRWIQGRRPILVAAIVLIAVQILWRAQFLSRMYFYRDDFFNLDFAIRSPFSWHYLTYVGTGHLEIVQRAIIWLLVSAVITLPTTSCWSSPSSLARVRSTSSLSAG